MYYVTITEEEERPDIRQGDEELGVFSHVIMSALANVEYPISKHMTHTREAQRVVTKGEVSFPKLG